MYLYIYNICIYICCAGWWRDVTVAVTTNEEGETKILLYINMDMYLYKHI